MFRQRRFPNTLGILTRDKNVLFVFFMGEAKGATCGALPPFSLEISPCKNFIMKSHPSKEVDFRKTFCQPDALPKVSVIMVRCVDKKLVAGSCSVLARSVSPTFGIDMAGYGGFTF